MSFDKHIYPVNHGLCQDISIIPECFIERLPGHSDLPEVKVLISITEC